jgi:hypothetical protein
MKRHSHLLLVLAAVVISVLGCGPVASTPTPTLQSQPTPTPYVIPDSGEAPPSELPEDASLRDLINFANAIGPLMQRAGEIVARDGEILKEAEGGNDAALCDGRLVADNLEMQSVMGEIAALQPPASTGDIHLLLLESSSSYSEALVNVGNFCSTSNALYKINALLKFWESAVKLQDAANRFWQLLVTEGVEMWVP